MGRTYSSFLMLAFLIKIQGYEFWFHQRAPEKRIIHMQYVAWLVTSIDHFWAIQLLHQKDVLAIILCSIDMIGHQPKLSILMIQPYWDFCNLFRFLKEVSFLPHQFDGMIVTSLVQCWGKIACLWKMTAWISLSLWKNL